MNTTLNLDGQNFEIASDETRLSAEFIERVWRKAGQPRTLDAEVSWKVVDVIMQVWGGLYPWELEAWKKNLQDEQSLERTVHEANKQNGGYFPISYPTRLLQMLRLKFPNEHYTDHKLILKFVKRYPILKRTKYNI